MRLEEVKDGTHYPVVVYFPRADVAAGALLPSDRHSRCPIKGAAGYFSVKAGSETLENAAWHYPDPLPDAAPVKDHVAFYPDQETVEKVCGRTAPALPYVTPPSERR